ncbi:IPT/TIG domain-containing protein [Hymenobacter sp. B81]|uniref:NHL domain-containing protein n=1 Tax=Hymenobacter sp. B81 TaxID=3344878 RepID=UPI0037DDC870
MHTLTHSWRPGAGNLRRGPQGLLLSTDGGINRTVYGPGAFAGQTARRLAGYLWAGLAALALVLLTLVPAAAQTYSITTRAGNGTAGFSGDGAAATSAQLNGPQNVAVDGSGNVFIADATNQRVRKVNAATGVVTTVAGTGSVGFSGDGGPATSAQLNFPTGVAVDGSGNLFIVDRINNRIRRVSAATGVVTTVAGTGSVGFSGDGGPATSAQLNFPTGVAVDGSGNLFIVDRINNRIRRVSAATGVITTVAGNGTSGFSGDGGPATSAQFNAPFGMAVDGSGNLFITDAINHRIRKVSGATGIITTVAGNGSAGFSGDGMAATSARLNLPQGVAVDGSGNLFIADGGNRCIRKVSAATGVITTVAGTGGTGGFSGDGGPATSARLGSSYGVAVDGSGNLFIADRNNNRIRRVSAATGIITTVAGTGTAGFGGDGGPATSAQFNDPRGVAVHSSGNLFITDTGNNRIRQLTPVVVPTLTSLSPSSGPVGTSVTLTGTGFTSGSTVRFNGTAATSVTFTSATSLRATVPTGATTGNVTVTTPGGTSNGRSFTVTLPVVPTLTGLNPSSGPVGTSVTLTGTGFTSGSTVRFNGTAATSVTFTSSTSLRATVPFGATTGNVTVTTPDGTSNGRSFTVTVIPDYTYTISTFAGTGGRSGFSGDGGPATSARLNYLTGVAVDGNGNVFIADNNNYRVRKVNAATGVITTVAGNGTFGFSGDGGPGASARISRPEGIAVDGSGNLYIADFGNNCIRKVSAATGVITTVAGNGTFISGFSGDGGPATSAQLDAPEGVAVDASGNLYIVDSNNYRIRKVSAATGIITTVAGNGTDGYGGDGGPATSARFDNPVEVAVDGSGNLYIGDNRNHRIRKVSAATGIITTVAGSGPAGPGPGGFSGDGGPATSARLNYPDGMAIDGSGNIFIADQGNHRIRRVNAATGIITTVAGNGINVFGGDGGPATSGQLANPGGVALGISGKIFISDMYNHCVRLLTPANVTPTLPALAAATVQLYPNPTRGAVTVLLPAGAGQVQAELCNALGQPVRRQAAAMGAPFTVETAGLAPGVYTLRLQAGTTTLAKRLVVQ